MELVEETYRIVKRLPKEENYALSDQMRRAAVSIPSNIAEGYSRLSPKDFARFIVIARGSVFELQTQLEICERLEYLPSKEISKGYQLCEEVSRMLYSLQKTL